MNKRMQNAELIILALMFILLLGFFLYMSNNIEEFKNVQNPQQYCKEQGFIDINIYNSPYEKNEDG